MTSYHDTIVAISTPSGSGALGVIRLSGLEAIAIAEAVFSRDLSKAKGHTLHYGNIVKEATVLDEAVAAVFRAPRSYTREDVVEFSCHGSPYILREVLLLLVEQGARLAEPGEFTRRAYLNGALDLAQAEAVADLIASTSAGAHQIAMNQLRGGVSRELKDLREQLLNFTSLIELELDFGEEDVEFADRTQLAALVVRIRLRLEGLISSFRLGNAIKQGVPTVIVGKPNAGKSTLLNALLNDNRAIVSDIPGTTRDVIEDRLHIGGIEFRLMDTAGLRHTSDLIEAEGVNRSLELAQKAQILIYVFDALLETPQEAQEAVQALDLPEGVEVALVGNKFDQIADPEVYVSDHDLPGLRYAWLGISAKTGWHLSGLRNWMTDTVRDLGSDTPGQVIISHARHIQALQKALTALHEVEEGLQNGLTGDLLAIDIRTVLYYIGEITGEISNDEVLGNIFSKFCIGK
ncbi:MAG: tRNA uridine-5-carboxymethylaminomethyl(34) synthesis GTPase MnmE [Bacteroidia bacterium]|nr:tRNA uridine-5-carboxymethylaminomethyl(34) synthesis GTPase MnmE [Bacteroidia bacterium]